MNVVDDSAQVGGMRGKQFTHFVDQEVPCRGKHSRGEVRGEQYLRIAAFGNVMNYKYGLLSIRGLWVLGTKSLQTKLGNNGIV